LSVFGYVGLPLAVALSRKHQVVGFDISSNRVAELRGGLDSTYEVSSEQLGAAKFHNYRRCGRTRRMRSFHRHRPDPDRQCQSAESRTPSKGVRADRPR
jgi:hypothetical protein